MKFYLEPKGWPCGISEAPYGLVARVRKGRALLYFKAPHPTLVKESIVYTIEGSETTITGQVTPVVLKTEK